MSTTPFAAVAPAGPYQLNPNPKSKADNYWNQVHQEANRLWVELQGKMPVWICSIEDRMNQIVGGKVFETDYRIAAMRLVGRTHRLATPEEIAGEQARVDKLGAEYAAQEDKRKQQSISKPSPESMQTQADLIGTVVQAVLQRVGAQAIQPAVEPVSDPALSLPKASRPPGKEEKQPQ